jgi:hypothetical protein
MASCLVKQGNNFTSFYFTLPRSTCVSLLHAGDSCEVSVDLEKPGSNMTSLKDRVLTQNKDNGINSLLGFLETSPLYVTMQDVAEGKLFSSLNVTVQIYKSYISCAGPIY